MTRPEPTDAFTWGPKTPAVDGENSDGGDVVDLRALWFIFRRRMGLFTAIAGVIVTLAVLVTFQLPATYKATASVLIDPRKTEIVDIAAVMSGLTLDSSVIETEAEVMRSRGLAMRVVETLSLYDDPEFNPSLVEPTGFQALTGDIKRSLRDVMSVLGPSAPEAGPGLSEDERHAREVQSAVDQLLWRLSVRRSATTYVINITVSSRDPQKASLIANTVAEQYLVDQLESKLEATRRANEWLLERLSGLADEVQAAEAAVEVYRTEHNLVDARGSTLTEQQIAELNGQLVIYRAELAEKEARLRTIERVRRSGGSGDELADVLNSPTIRDLRAQQATVIRRKGDLEARYGPMYPEILRVNRELADIQTEIDAEVSRVLASLRNETIVARDRVASIESSLAEVTEELQANNVALIQLRQLEREAEASRQIYENFLARSEQTSQQASLQEADARIISRADPPFWPASPNRKLNVILAAVLASGVGLLTIFLVETFESGLRTAEDIERLTGEKCLAVLPRVGAGVLRGQSVASVADAVVDKPFAEYAEAVRSLRASLLLSRERRGVRTLAVTSTSPAEGKSSLAFSLARMSAMMQVKTILVDADVRRRQATIATKNTSKPGLLDLFDERSDLADVIVKDSRTDLDILPAGMRDAASKKIFPLEKMAEILEVLKSEYDFVVVDTTPLLAVAEAREVATLVDSVLLGVRWRKTQRSAVKSALRVLHSVDAPLAGAVLLQANMRLRALYAGEGWYGGVYGSYYHK